MGAERARRLPRFRARATTAVTIGVDRRDSRARLSRAASEEPRRRDGRVPPRQWPRRQYRSGLATGAGAVPGGGRDHRQRRTGPHHAWPPRSASATSRRALPTASRRAKRCPSIPPRSRCGAAGRAASAPSRSASSRCRSFPTRPPRSVSPRRSPRPGLDRLPWTKALRQWRDRVAFLRGAEGDEWPDLSHAALADSAVEWLAPLLGDKTALAALSRRRNSNPRSRTCCLTR